MRASAIREKADALRGRMRERQDRMDRGDVAVEDMRGFTDETQRMLEEYKELRRQERTAMQLDDVVHRGDFNDEHRVARVPNGGGGDLRFRTETPDMIMQRGSPSLATLRHKRDLLERRARHGPDALTQEENQVALRTFPGEHVFWRFLAGVQLSSQERSAFHEQQELQRALSDTVLTTTDADGGYLVPVETEAEIYHQMAFTGPFAGPMSPLGDWRSYMNGRDREVNVNTSSQSAEAEYVAEAADANPTHPTWEQVNLDFKTIRHSMPLTVQADEDSVSDLQTELQREMATAFARRLNNDLTKGGGGTALTGITHIGLTRTFTSSTALADRISADEFINLKRQVNRAYRGGPQFAYTFRDDMLGVIELLKDTNGAYLFTERPGAMAMSGMESGGYASVIRGVPPVYANDGFDAIGANAVVGAVGDFSRFRIGYVRGMTVLTDTTTFQRSLQRVLWGYMRVASIVADANAFRLFRLGT